MYSFNAASTIEARLLPVCSAYCLSAVMVSTEILVVICVCTAVTPPSNYMLACMHACTQGEDIDKYRQKEGK